MSMYISEDDVRIVVRSALRRIATCLGVQNTDLMSSFELYQVIASLDQQLTKLFDAFYKAYSEWYKFHLDRADLIIYEEIDRQSLEVLKTGRDSTRNALIEALQERGC